MKRVTEGIRWTPHQDQYTKFSSQFSASYMSNAKWRKVFTAIADAIANSSLRVTIAEWKWLDSDKVQLTRVPHHSDILYQRFADGELQPVEYKWIEWIRFPRVYKPHKGIGLTVDQDIDALFHLLTSCAQLQLEIDSEQLTLFAYGRKIS